MIVRFSILSILTAAACYDGIPRGRIACRLYRPTEAKQTFDGRVGRVLVWNATDRATEVKVYHPDGVGDVEQTWPLAANDTMVLDERDGTTVPYGNDWGIQVNGSCIVTLGETAEWQAGEFSLRWDGDSLRAGLRGSR